MGDGNQNEITSKTRYSLLVTPQFIHITNMCPLLLNHHIGWLAQL